MKDNSVQTSDATVPSLGSPDGIQQAAPLMYDVVAVNMETCTVRLMAEKKSRRNAEAIVTMSVMRRGVDEEFYSECLHRLYKTGDRWEGPDGPTGAYAKAKGVTE